MGASETYAAIGVLLSLLGIVIVLVVARACRCINNLGRSTEENYDSHEGAYYLKTSGCTGTEKNIITMHSYLEAFKSCFKYVRE